MAAPATKVEESFNTQAMHDLLFQPLDTPGYVAVMDHSSFPGVVPRSFLPPLAVTALVRPLFHLGCLPIIHHLTHGRCFFGLPKLLALYLVRVIIGGLGVAGLAHLRRQVSRRYGADVARAFGLLLLGQFHLLYYISRPLPNTFALLLVLPAIAAYLAGDVLRVITLFAFAGLVIRAELVLLAVPMLAYMLLSQPGHFPFRAAVSTALSAAVAALATTVLVDSVYWQRWLWPEGEVLWFNTADNRSSEWGTSPWHWYASSAMPRALLASYPLALLAVACQPRAAAPVAVPAVSMLVAYSFLPHKELRFVIYVVPLLTLLAAQAVVWLRRRCAPWLFAVATAATLAASMACIVIFLTASAYNYPGAEAMTVLHASRAADIPRVKHVHIDAAAAISGISRFWESDQTHRWRYSKDESVATDTDRRLYDYLITERSSVPEFHTLAEISGFHRFSPSWPPVWSKWFRLEPKLYVLEHDRCLEPYKERIHYAAAR